MVIVLLFASLLGTAITFTFLWPYGGLVALLCAPFGGSTMAGLVGGLVALRQAGGQGLDPAQEQATDEFVAALRQAAEPGRPSESPPALSTEPGRKAA